MRVTKIPGLIVIHEQILGVLKDHPEGLTIHEIREAIPNIGIQQHLDKRVRDLRYHYDVPLVVRGGKSVYILGAARIGNTSGTGRVTSKVRASILHRAHGRCQMCGRTVADDGIKLQVDHRIPRNWGGIDDADNLWALCELCNSGKRDYFATFDDEVMKAIMKKESVYERIAETLRLHLGEPTPSWLLEFVANADDWQDDWQKRLRELRYPPIGLKIRASRVRNKTGRWTSNYTLDEWKELPTNHKFLIKEHERVTRNRSKSSKYD
jgi:5-methylcytosine-specific restriction endonuclease McrA